MELRRWDECTKIITIRITEAEYNALLSKVQNENRNKCRNKASISSMARKMIRYCLIREIEDLD